jgi:hypothetical protein
MSQNFDFTRFVPGFDFLKSLTPAAGANNAASQWVAPTINPEELEKRIAELKTVHFWLDQNTKAVGATIQAMEVQRMTLSALKEMNVSFAEMAQSFKIKPTPQEQEQEQPASSSFASAKPEEAASSTSTDAQGQASQGAVDPAQWWGALTQQFQTIATNTMQDLAKNSAVHEQMMAAAKSTVTKTAFANKAASSKKASTSSDAAKPTKPATAKKSASSTRVRKPSAAR